MSTSVLPPQVNPALLVNDAEMLWNVVEVLRCKVWLRLFLVVIQLRIHLTTGVGNLPSIRDLDQLESIVVFIACKQKGLLRGKQ